MYNIQSLLRIFVVVRYEIHGTKPRPEFYLGPYGGPEPGLQLKTCQILDPY